MQKLGVDPADIAELSGIIAEADAAAVEPGRLSEALAWSKATAERLTFGSAGSVLGSLVLSFFGLS